MHWICPLPGCWPCWNNSWAVVPSQMGQMLRGRGAFSSIHTEEEAGREARGGVRVPSATPSLALSYLWFRTRPSPTSDCRLELKPLLSLPGHFPFPLAFAPLLLRRIGSAIHRRRIATPDYLVAAGSSSVAPAAWVCFPCPRKWGWR